jgi:HD superfamily phosphodiesterase
MVDYSGLIADLKLVTQLKKSAGRDAIHVTEIEKLVAMVNNSADTAGPLLERIPQTFKQYTDHNIGHCHNLIDLMGRFIPEQTLDSLNGLELAVLILSALLHDFGMFVTEQEKRKALKSEEYDSFLLSHHDRATAVLEARERGDHSRAEVIEDALLAEYFRRMHPERARINVRRNLEGKLMFRDEDISPHVLDVCESHAWGVRESNDPAHSEKAVSRLPTNRAVYGVPERDRRPLYAASASGRG